jgi:two-component system, LytTR family, response regulator LytT
MMDIQLSDGISFEIFEQAKVAAPVIFTTAYDEYAIRAFKVNSIDYLLKTHRPGQFGSCTQ